ncbi:MAG: tetraacyldisaccharide 4'-kinase [Pseudomonadota bacterium]
MKPPRFWFKKHATLSSILLAPLGWLYAFGTARRLAAGSRERLGIPVICVGNINLGGTGKTPTVIALIEMLKDMGRKPAVVSRGYGGALDGPVKVLQNHKPSEVGDEPILLATFADVWVSKDRLEGAKAAAHDGADVLILDDGLQNPALHYDLTLTVVDAKMGFGNGSVFPAGPLREPVNVGLSRTDLVISVGGQIDLDHPPVINAALNPIDMGMDWADAHIVAFAGIGRPEKFFATLKKLGATLVATHAFDDHQPFNDTILARLEREAFHKHAILVTTEKDAVRLPEEWRHHVMSLPVRMRFDDPKPLEARIKALFK